MQETPSLTVFDICSQGFGCDLQGSRIRHLYKLGTLKRMSKSRWPGSSRFKLEKKITKFRVQ